MLVIPVLGGRDIRAILNYIMSLRQAWTMRDPVSKKETNKETTEGSYVGEYATIVTTYIKHQGLAEQQDGTASESACWSSLVS